MRLLAGAMLVSGALWGTAACGGECAQAFDKELECMEDGERKTTMASARDIAIEMCKTKSEDPEVKAAIACGKKATCEEVKACKKEARAQKDIKKISDMVASGEVSKAAQRCSYDLETYKAVGGLKTACDAAFDAAFGKLDDKKVRDDLTYRCGRAKDAADWRDASESMKKGCNGLMAAAKSTITKQRDAGTKYEYSECSGYKALVKALAPKEAAAAELLCAEAKAAEDLTKAAAEVSANLKANKLRIPYRCERFMKMGDKKLKGSKWHTAKSKELAASCYGGDLGKKVLGKVTTYCLSDAKSVHKYAAQYKLGAADAELAALLTKTQPTCTK